MFDSSAIKCGDQLNTPQVYRFLQNNQMISEIKSKQLQVHRYRSLGMIEIKYKLNHVLANRRIGNERWSIMQKLQIYRDLSSLLLTGGSFSVGKQVCSLRPQSLADFFSFNNNVLKHEL